MILLLIFLSIKLGTFATSLTCLMVPLVNAFFNLSDLPQDVTPALLLHSFNDGQTRPFQEKFPKLRILLHDLSTLCWYGLNLSQPKFLI